MTYSLTLLSKGRNSLFNQNTDLKNISPLTYAFVGDSVYELLVRDYVVSLGNAPLKKLNTVKVEYVRCEFQAAAVSKLVDIFSEDEKDVFLRGRNAHVGHVPKNSTTADYHMATALECVFGYLYLKNDTNRIKELFSKIIENI